MHKTQEVGWRGPARQPLEHNCPLRRKQQGQTLGPRGKGHRQAEVRVLAGTQTPQGLRTTARTVVWVLRNEKPPEALSRGTIYLYAFPSSFMQGALSRHCKILGSPLQSTPTLHFTRPCDLKKQVLGEAPQNPSLPALLPT